jgi:CysZ protein
MVLGLIPALIVAIAFVVGFVALGLNLESIAAVVTPFAAGWDEPYRTGIRVVVGLAFLAVAVLILIYTFTTVTLIVGQPFYERIWRRVEGRYGPVPEAGPAGFWRTLGSGIADGLRMLVPTVLIGVALVALGLVPLVGTVAAAVLGAFVGGWFLAVELTGTAFDARGRTLRQRRAALRGRRPLVVGFGVVTYLLFLVPLGAVLMMPAAVAGSAMLARRVLGDDILGEATTASLPRTG